MFVGFLFQMVELESLLASRPKWITPNACKSLFQSARNLSWLLSHMTVENYTSKL